MGEEALYGARISQNNRITIKDKCIVKEDILF